MSGCNSAGAAERSHPSSEVRGSSPEEQPHDQGTVAVWAQEGLEELFHVQGQEGRLVQDKRNPSKTEGVARGHQRADTLKL